jgi:hypothetical protein
LPATPLAGACTVNDAFARRIGGSSLTMVPVADLGVPVALVAEVNCTLNVSFFSGVLSPMIVTGMLSEVCPGEKLRVPDAAV